MQKSGCRNESKESVSKSFAMTEASIRVLVRKQRDMRNLET